MVFIHLRLVAVLAAANLVLSQSLPTVDLDYAIYQGSRDTSSDFNIFAG